MEERKSIIDIQNQAYQLLKDSGVEGQFPLPIDNVVDYLGYDAKSFIPDASGINISGAVSSKEKKILINNNDSIFRKRFTLAHEIGHIILHFNNHDEEFVDFRTDRVRDTKELQADEFAGCLLMPIHEFKKIWLKSKGNSFYLSEFFGVSKPAVYMRALNLGLA